MVNLWLTNFRHCSGVFNVDWTVKFTKLKSMKKWQLSTTMDVEGFEGSCFQVYLKKKKIEYLENNT